MDGMAGTDDTSDEDIDGMSDVIAKIVRDHTPGYAEDYLDTEVVELAEAPQKKKRRQKKKNLLEAPQAEYVAKTIEASKAATIEAEKIVEVQQVEYVERIVHVPKVVTHEVEKIVEVPQVEYVEKIVEMPKPVTKEVRKLVEVPQVEYDEKIVHVPKVATHEAEKFEEAPQVEHVEKNVGVPMLESRLDAVEDLLAGFIPMLQQEMVKPLTARVEACRTETEDICNHFTSLVRNLEREVYALFRKLENAGFEGFEDEFT